MREQLKDQLRKPWPDGSTEGQGQGEEERGGKEESGPRLQRGHDGPRAILGEPMTADSGAADETWRRVQGVCV